MDDFDKVDNMFDSILKKFPEKRKKLVERVGTIMYDQVVNNIDSKVKQDTKKLKQGITKKISSGGGHVTAEPNYSIAPNSALIEEGYKKVREGNIVGWVNGKHMYRDALNQASDEIINEVEKMIDELVGDLDG